LTGLVESISEQPDVKAQLPAFSLSTNRKPVFWIGFSILRSRSGAFEFGWLISQGAVNGIGAEQVKPTGAMSSSYVYMSKYKVTVFPG
jgi:hypothetical protein